MLRVNVGLSRKLSKDYNSTGYSVNLDGEILAAINDPEAVIEQVKELFDLAEESLSQQIERAESEAAIGSRDILSAPEATPQTNGHHSNESAATKPPSGNGKPTTTGNGQAGEEATNKQIQFLLSIGKRQGLSTADLERKISDLLDKEIGIYHLSKRDAAKVIDALNGSPTNGRAYARR